MDTKSSKYSHGEATLLTDLSNEEATNLFREAKLNRFQIFHLKRKLIGNGILTKDEEYKVRLICDIVEDTI